jgi:hypothetical protein
MSIRPLRPQFQIQIKPDGEWHRPEIGNGGNHTACGQPIAGGFRSRDFELTDNLCLQCFTEHEVETGQLKRIEREAIERAEAEEEVFDNFDDDPTPVDDR